MELSFEEQLEREAGFGNGLEGLPCQRGHPSLVPELCGRLRPSRGVGEGTHHPMAIRSRFPSHQGVDEEVRSAGRTHSTFLVDEGIKWRTIGDARFPNQGQDVPWFSLPSVMDLARVLLVAQCWAKQDLKAGWHHIPLSTSHTKMFGYVYKGVVWC